MGKATDGPSQIYLVGGVSAALMEWRETAIDVYLKGDVKEMFSRGFIEGNTLRLLFAEIEPELNRFPAIETQFFRERVEALSIGA